MYYLNQKKLIFQWISTERIKANLFKFGPLIYYQMAENIKVDNSKLQHYSLANIPLLFTKKKKLTVDYNFETNKKLHTV